MQAGVADSSHVCGRAGVRARVEPCGQASGHKIENECQTSSLSTAKDGFRRRVERGQVASRSEHDLTSVDSLSTVPAAPPNPHKDWPDDHAALLELAVDVGKQLPSLTTLRKQRRIMGSASSPRVLTPTAIRRRATGAVRT